jgi:hypothetical protein
MKRARWQYCTPRYQCQFTEWKEQLIAKWCAIHPRPRDIHPFDETSWLTRLYVYVHNANLKSLWLEQLWRYFGADSCPAGYDGIANIRYVIQCSSEIGFSRASQTNPNAAWQGDFRTCPFPGIAQDNTSHIWRMISMFLPSTVQKTSDVLRTSVSTSQVLLIFVHYKQRVNDTIIRAYCKYICNQSD